VLLRLLRRLRRRLVQVQALIGVLRLLQRLGVAGGCWRVVRGKKWGGSNEK
jgi:hypothetical protein